MKFPVIWESEKEESHSRQFKKEYRFSYCFNFKIFFQNFDPKSCNFSITIESRGEITPIFSNIHKREAIFLLFTGDGYLRGKREQKGKEGKKERKPLSPRLEDSSK